MTPQYSTNGSVLQCSLEDCVALQFVDEGFIYPLTYSLPWKNFSCHCNHQLKRLNNISVQMMLIIPILVLKYLYYNYRPIITPMIMTFMKCTHKTHHFILLCMPTLSTARSKTQHETKQQNKAQIMKHTQRMPVSTSHAKTTKTTIC